MSELLADTIGRDTQIPANTLIILFDIAFVSRPGPGGYAAILARGDAEEIQILRGAHPEASTTTLLAQALARLAPEIGNKRALFITRSQEIADLLSARLKAFRMLRVLGSSPIAVCEATRHASIVGERSWHTRKTIEETFRIAPRIEQLDDQELLDIGPIQKAIGTAAEKVDPNQLSQPAVAAQAQALLDKANATRLFSLGAKIKSMLRVDFSRQGKG